MLTDQDVAREHERLKAEVDGLTRALESAEQDAAMFQAEAEDARAGALEIVLEAAQDRAEAQRLRVQLAEAQEATHTSADCAEQHDLVRDFGGPRPEIVVLCGSTKFKDQINATNARLTMEGKLVISLGVFGHVDLPDRDWSTGGSDDKRLLDELHKRKIDLADRVYVVNPGGYIGESTNSEIEYALANGKPVDYLEPLW